MPGVVYVPGSPDFLVLYVDFSSEDVKVEKKPFVTREQLEEIKKLMRLIQPRTIFTMKRGFGRMRSV